MGRPVIFVVPHPDDETLGAGVSIAEHVDAGRDVRVLLMTRGTGTGAIRKLNGVEWSRWWGVWHKPDQEGYAPFTPDALGDVRYREAVAALACLGVTQDRIYEASTLLGEPVLDGSVTKDQAKRAILALADIIGTGSGTIGLWTPTHTVDDNPDHIAIGQASLQLGKDDPVRWSDRRYWILPPYWSDARLSQVDEMWDNPNDTASELAIEVQRRARNACRVYASWNPAAGSFAVGYHSVDYMFAQMDGTTSTNAPKCLIHK